MVKYSWHNESVLHPATSECNSLRTTVPAYIVNQFNLEKGDKLRWGTEDGSVVIQVAKPEKKTLRS
jgi:antitoxin component of MazEF toxin-antitoxin module